MTMRQWWTTWPMLDPWQWQWLWDLPGRTMTWVCWAVVRCADTSYNWQLTTMRRLRWQHWHQPCCPAGGLWQWLLPWRLLAGQEQLGRPVSYIWNMKYSSMSEIIFLVGARMDMWGCLERILMVVAPTILLWMEQHVSGDLDHRDKRWIKYYSTNNVKIFSAPTVTKIFLGVRRVWNLVRSHLSSRG